MSDEKPADDAADGAEKTENPLLDEGLWFRAGPATLVVRDGAWIVLVPGARKSLIDAAWAVLKDRPDSADALMSALIEKAGFEGPDDLKAVMFGFTHGESTTICVKGSTPIGVYTADGSQQVIGTDEEPVVTKTFDGVRRVAFGDLPDESSTGGLRIETGMARIRGFVHALVDPSSLDDDARSALAQQVKDDGRSIETEEAKKKRAEAPPPPPKPKPSTSSSSSGSFSSMSPRSATAATRRMSSPSRTSSTRGPAKPETPEKPAGPSVFDNLFSSSPTQPASAAPAPAQPAPAAQDAVAPAAPASSTPAASAASASTAPATETTPAAAPPADGATASSASAQGTASSPQSEQRPRRRLVSTSLFDRRRAAPAKEKTAPAQSPAPQQAPQQEETPPQPSPADENPVQPSPAPAEESAPTPNTDSVEPPASTEAETAKPTAPVEPAEPAARAESAEPPASAEAEPEPGAPAEPAEPAAPAEEDSAAAAAPADSAAPAEPAMPGEPARPQPAPRSSATSMPTPEPPEDDDSPVTLVAPIDDDDAGEDDAESAAAAAPAQNAPASAPSLPSDTEDDGADEYDDLFGKTIFRRIEDAAVRKRDDEHEDEPAQKEKSPAPEPKPEPESPQQGSENEQTSALAQPLGATADAASSTIGGDFIDWVPGVGREAPEIAHTAARRAAAPPPPPTAYPQVHMPERPPTPTRAQHVSQQPAPPAGQNPAYPSATSVPGSAAQQIPPQQPAPGQYGPGHPAMGSPAAPPQGYGAPQHPVGPHYPAGPQRPAAPMGPAGHAPGAPQPPASWQQGSFASPAAPQPVHRPAPPQMGQRPAGPHPTQGFGAPGQPPHGASPQAPAAAPPGIPQQGQPPQGMRPQGASPQGPRHASAPHPVPAAGPAPQASAAPQHAPAAPPGPGNDPASARGENTHRGTPRSSSSNTSAPQLVGVVCPAGHANPPERGACFVCGAALGGATETVTRPVLGSVEISTGGSFTLERSAIIGRRPRASRVSGSDVPQLVTVPSPQQDVSRSHLELRLEGWRVLAVDLGTTNGTTLLRAGNAARRLRPREGVGLISGDTLDLGDGVVLLMRGLP